MAGAVNTSMNEKLLWDEKIAREFAVSISKYPVSPNQITFLSFILTLVSGFLFASGITWEANIAALLFMIVRFLDHLDGELARIKKCESRFGHYFDWFVDTFSYAYLFITLAIGFRNEMNSTFLIMIVSFAVAACLINTLIGLVIERHKRNRETPSFPVIGGFGIDDSMYLIGPITWIGYLFHFFILCAIGAAVYMASISIKFILSLQ